MAINNLFPIITLAFWQGSLKMGILKNDALMEQEVSAVLENEGWTVFESTPIISALPGKHILAEPSITLCLSASTSVKLENS